MIRLYLIIATLFATGGCAAYRIGNSALFRTDIRTVHVPVFESDSLRQFLGERLTEAVIREMECRAPYKVVLLRSADSILKGKIIADQKRIQIESLNDDGRDIQTNLVVQVSWTDRFGRPLMGSQNITIREFANFVPEAGQSLSTAHQKIIDKVARDIVSQMEFASL